MYIAHEDLLLKSSVMKLVRLIQSFVDIGILGQVAMGTTLTSTKMKSCKQLALKHRERSPERFVVLLQRFVKILSRSVEHYENIYAELNLIKRAWYSFCYGYYSAFLSSKADKSSEQRSNQTTKTPTLKRGTDDSVLYCTVGL